MNLRRGPLCESIVALFLSRYTSKIGIRVVDRKRRLL